MMRTLLCLLLIASPFFTVIHAQDECDNAILLTDVDDWCSGPGTYSNTTATPSAYGKPGCWTGNLQDDVWFKFVAVAPNLSVKVYGQEYNSGTMRRPRVAVYSGVCGGTINEIACEQSNNGQHFVELYKNGLAVGQTYYIRVDALNGGAYDGTFALCVNNNLAPTVAGQDCNTATYLCTMETISFQFNGGAGSNNDEANNTCLDDYNFPFGAPSESNSTWLVWECGVAGTLDFIIVPTKRTDDIDFALFRLPNGANNCNGKQLLRCMASSCTQAGGTAYTGLLSTETDNIEDPGCNWPDNNFVDDIDMVAGEAYGLLINNFSSASNSNGFQIIFGGTGSFKDFEADFEVARDCGSNTVTFTNTSTNAASYEWNFGVNAISPYTTSTLEGPHTITYPPGSHTAVLTITEASGCQDLHYVTFDVPIAVPSIGTTVNNISCGSTNDGSITVNVSGGTGPFQYSNDGGLTYTAPLAATTYTFNNLTANTYNIIVKDVNSCQETVSVAVGPSASCCPTIQSGSSNPEICDQLNGSITISVGSTGVAPYDFSINGGSSYILNNVSGTQTIPNLASGTYSIFIRDNTGCTVDTTITINDTGNDVSTNLTATTCIPANAGTSTQNLTTYQGCDSIVTTVTTLLASYDYTINATDCDPANVGSSTQNLTTYQGCDSIVTTAITLLASYDYTINATDCDPANVGTNTQNLTTYQGCDSIVTTVTTLLASYDYTINATDCDPANVGTSTQNLTTYQGCDSIVTTITTLLASYDYTINATDCDPANVGSNTQNLTTYQGCDSIVTTVTTLLASYDYTINATDCDPANVGTNTQNLTTYQGCDSIITTVTTLLASYDYTINATDCDPANVGTSTQNLTTYQGCDSIVTTVTTLLASYDYTINATDCDPANVGTSTQNLTTYQGCDSIVTTVTTLLASYDYTINATDCDPANVGSNTQNLTTYQGCDSIVTTVTTLLASYDYTINATDCDPANVGTSTQNLTTYQGCDSIVTTVTTLLASYDYTINATDCDPANVGTSTQNLTTYQGCDSIVTTVTTLLASYDYTINATDCDPANVGTSTQNLTTYQGCDSIVITVTTLLASYDYTINATDCDPANVGTSTQNLTTYQGCDSIVTTVTTLLASYDYTINATDCDPANVGTSTQNLTTYQGCDSIVTTVTTLLASSGSTINATSCNPADVGTISDTLVAFNGCDSIVTTVTTLNTEYNITVTATSCNPANVGSEVDTFNSVLGCDSIVTTVTSLLPSYDIQLTDQSCNPADTGVFVQTLTSVEGCDSIITNTVTLINSYDIQFSSQSCNPADTGVTVQQLTSVDGCDSIVTSTVSLITSYDIQTVDQSCNPADTGVFVQTLTSVGGCDSIITNTVSLIASYDIQTVDQSCNPTDTGIFIQTLISTDGCDSIVTRTVSLVSSYDIQLINQSCNPADTGVFVQTLTSVEGCDSVITNTVALINSYDIQFSSQSCNPADTGVTVQQLTSMDGCDSIVTNTITLIPSSNGAYDVSLCVGEIYILPSGDTISTPGVYFDTIPGNVCDSINIVTVTVGNFSSAFINETICEGDSLELPNGDYVQTAGVYTDTISLSGSCDQIVSITLQVSSPQLDTIITTNANCNGTDGTVDININGGISPFRYEITNSDGTTSSYSQSIITLNGGSYTLMVMDSVGCLLSSSFIIRQDSISGLSVTPGDTSIFYGESIDMESTPSTGIFEWFPIDFLSCNDCPNPTITPETSIYYLISREENDCIVTDTVYIEVRLPDAFIPSAFSPNGDNQNDILYVIDTHVRELISFEVYNRWGELLFKTSDITQGWDAFYKGDQQEMDTYIYHLRLIDITGKEQDLSGAVLLLR
ncbi:MAG: gliding motility-associated C-terminal domain-containing protein [Chitinophagales bacterium]